MDPNSLLFWYPQIVDTKIPQPRTTWIEIPRLTLVESIDDIGALEPYREALFAAGDSVGYPLFLRSDQTSAKHDWKDTCFVPDKRWLLGHIAAIADFSECAGFLGLPVEAMVLREFIEMDSAFIAFGRMPVSRERRYFVRDGGVVCHHPYWPESAIRFWASEEPPDWRKQLAALNTETPEEVSKLTAYAVEISSLVPGCWSVDFCRAADGTWYFIDMAVAEQSWHPECPNAAPVIADPLDAVARIPAQDMLCKIGDQ